MLTLISATPSPYARKNRIALIEKGIPFDLKSEIPWESATCTPQYNPLEKFPILLFDDGRTPPIYESWYINEYITTKYRGTGPDLMPESLDDQLLAKKIQIIADGANDAMGLAFFETGRGEKKSEEWMARQLRKVYGALDALNEFVAKMGMRNHKHGKSDGFLVGNELTIADIAAGSALGSLAMVERDFGFVKWTEKYPELRQYWERLEERESFRQTKPFMFQITEKVV